MIYTITINDKNYNELTRKYEISEDELSDKEKMGEILIEMAENLNEFKKNFGMPYFEHLNVIEELKKITILK